MLLTAAPARAAYPERQITLVVPYAAGGTADTLGRMVAEGMADALKSTVIVENKGGAGGVIGCATVAKASNDGYTLLFTAGGPLTIGPNLRKTPPYQTTTAFTPIGLLAQVPSFLVVHPQSPVRSVADLIAASKNGTLRYGSPGFGTSVHLLGELFRQRAGNFEAVHVPYRGGAPAMSDLLGGHIDFMFENAPQLLPQITAGALRAIVVTAPKRLSVTPDVPAFAELGIGDIGFGTWYGMLTPPSLPDPLRERLQAAFHDVTQTPAFSAKLVELGANPDIRIGARFAEFIVQDQAQWRDVIAKGNVEIQD
ncbi:tripartite tricarboxylate transporter substrate binding protein [Bradyrhizobium sp. CCGUVB1N3]|uniref:Bug family tripartite tricarboxylate transporter substrate binding protein n=1 Tax=Bradyrhizobium sp. CCGUVB1N3 TaxID=2949629 RepID=UPI0020B42ED6|nr:tripartite tricarboxylate transporter substrate binding protein [Bradyrhizobium sp. CCGUVB1N3]MCP3474094.1 tripartite tricarboxylate transporter substrate binding protein [Bradyrhizobium sp. CCGUVB1N3]